MSKEKNRSRQVPAPAPARPPRQEPVAAPVAPGPFAIKFPLLWLLLAAVVVYAGSLGFGLTDLDDTIFIKDFQDYNADLGNFFTSFGRGLFDATRDPYYRPLFADSMLLNAHFMAGEVAGYHLVNLLLHLGCVALLYKLLLRLKVAPLTAFLLSLLFAVHPALSQAVAWIPGRNDTMLAFFTLLFLLLATDYADKGRVASLLLSVVCLLLAFFTKETAVFAAPVAFVLIVVLQQQPWRGRRNLLLYGTWIACFVVWYVARDKATAQSQQIGIVHLLAELPSRLPLIWQYLGKLLLPVNLSVFPVQQDTSNVPGLIAIGMLAALLLGAKSVNWRVVLAGAAIYMLFILPALLVPASLNEQVFEQRLYLPVIGILLVLSQTVIFKLPGERVLLGGMVALCAGLGIVNYAHQRDFKDPLTFWTAAVNSSPHSAYANMMLGSRINNDMPRSCALFRKAYQLNPKEKYLNFYYGKMLQIQDSVLESEPHLLTEQQISGYFECDFYLARVAMTKKDTSAALRYLQAYLKADPANPQANNNVLLIFVTRGQMAAARQQAERMRAMGLALPPQLQQQLGVR